MSDRRIEDTGQVINPDPFIAIIRTERLPGKWVEQLVVLQQVSAIYEPWDLSERRDMLRWLKKKHGIKPNRFNPVFRFYCDQKGEKKSVKTNPPT